MLAFNQRFELLRAGAGGGAVMAERGLSLLSCHLNRLPFGTGSSLGQLDPGRQPLRALEDGAGGGGFAPKLISSGLGLLPGQALGLRGAVQGVCTSGQRAGPLLGRAQGQPGLHLGLAGLTGEARQPITLCGVRLGQIVLATGGSQPVFEFGQFLPIGRLITSGLLDRGLQPGSVSTRATPGLPQRAQLFGQRRHLSVRFIQLLSSDCGLLLGLPQAFIRGRQRKPNLFGLVAGRVELGLGFVDTGLYLDHRGLRARPTTGEPRCHQIALGGSSPHLRKRTHQRPGRLQIGHQRHFVEQLPQSGHDPGISLDRINRPADPVGQLRPFCRVLARGIAEQQARPAEVFGLQPVERVESRDQIGHHQRLGRRPQRSRDSLLPGGIDLDHARQRAEQTIRQLSCEQRAGRITALQAQLQGVDTSGQRGTQPFRVLLAAAQRRDLLAHRRLGGSRRFVSFVQTKFAVAHPAKTHLQEGVLVFGILCASEGLGEPRLQPRLLFTEGLQPGLQRVDLPGESGQALAAVGDRPQLRCIAASLSGFG